MTVLVTGGAGFIGANVVHALLDSGEEVRIFDDLSRLGVDRNLLRLEEIWGKRAELVMGDIRDRSAIRDALVGIDHVFHFAAQVAVTTSLAEPTIDFDVNAYGTLALLEEMRARRTPPSLVFTSTSKVYGHLDDVALRVDGDRYQPADERLSGGITEARPLSFASPFGCSKGAADQYVLDFARTFDIPAMVLRTSCIYGPHQHGNEDEGWVTCFLAKALRGEPITLYGDGRQVRDVLFVDDFVDALRRARRKVRELRGRAFNVGGGAASSMSLLELLSHLRHRLRLEVRHSFAEWRAGDQRWYVSDTTAFQEATGWCPRVGTADGLRRLHDWLSGETQTRAPVLDAMEAL